MSDADLQGLCLSYVKHYGLRLAYQDVRRRSAQPRELKCDPGEPRQLLEAFVNTSGTARRQEQLLRYENLKGGSLSKEAGVDSAH